MCDSVDALLRDGYVVLGGCFARDAARELVLRLGCGVEYETLAACLEDEDLALGPSRTNFRLRRHQGLLMASALSGLLDELGETHTWYDASIITALAGRGRQPSHRDYSKPVHSDEPWKVVVFTPLDTVHPRGGVTCVYPGTHLQDLPAVARRIRLDPGDALVFFSTLQHYGAANNSTTHRILLSQTFDVRVRGKWASQVAT